MALSQNKTEMLVVVYIFWLHMKNESWWTEEYWKMVVKRKYHLRASIQSKIGMHMEKWAVIVVSHSLSTLHVWGTAIEPVRLLSKMAIPLEFLVLNFSRQENWEQLRLACRSCTHAAVQGSATLRCYLLQWQAIFGLGWSKLVKAITLESLRNSPSK